MEKTLSHKIMDIAKQFEAKSRDAYFNNLGESTEQAYRDQSQKLRTYAGLIAKCANRKDSQLLYKIAKREAESIQYGVDLFWDESISDMQYLHMQEMRG